MTTNSSSKWGVLKVFARVGDKYTKIPLSCSNFTIGSDPKAIIKVCRDDVDPIHCIVRIQNNGLATLVNKSKENPVPINNESVAPEMFLLPNDTFSVMGKRFRYENSSLEPEIIREAKLKNIERLKRLKRITVLERNLLTPQPEKPKTLKARRSASLDAKRTQSPEDKARKALADDGCNIQWLKTSTPQTPHPTKTTRLRCVDGFTVSTPRSAIRPSLRHSAIFKNLSQMSYVEPEGCESSSSTVDREEALKTPVTEMITKDDEDLLTTPLNNTSVITVDSPIEEDVTPLRSRKSKAKDISIQRLTQNDESVVVLDTPESKTPKTALKTPMSVHKTNLLVGYSAIESNVASVIDSSADECSAPETDSESNELQPSKSQIGLY
ncbi:uncharacterized protein [Atheta coriaria]|uniref:uncharacterized protein isoform X1 n=1 Tax=Dalotia coriaria TaxID=877792 RepID=UPI0031F3CB98